VGLAPYELSGIDRKGNIEAVRQEVKCSFDYSMSKAEMGEKNKRK